MSTIDSKTIKQIIANLAKEGMTLSESQIMDALKTNNMDITKALSNIAKKVQDGNSDTIGSDDKKKNIIESDKKIENKHKDIYGKPTFKNKYSKKNSKIAVDQRLTHLPQYTSDNRVDMMVQQHNQLKSLSLELADLERGQPLQQDEMFTVILDEQEGNFLKNIQNSIGAANEYKKKYNITQAAKKNGTPSVDLLGKLV